MTELEKSMEIIQFISNAKKTTPVKMFTDEEIKNAYDAKVIGKDGLKIVIDGKKMDLSGVKSMQIDLEIEHKTICIDRREVMILEN